MEPLASLGSPEMEPLGVEDDLMNIEYNDLVSMVKNLKKTKADLKSKQKEITRLQNRLKDQTNDIATLQAKCSQYDKLKQEYEVTSSENNLLKSKLVELGSENENLIHAIEVTDAALNQLSNNEKIHLQNISQFHEEFRLLSEKYVALQLVTRQYDTSIAQEKANKTALQSRLIMTESKLNDLVKENLQLKDEIAAANHRLAACDGDLAHASNQLYDLSLELSSIEEAHRSREEQSWSRSWEVELLRADITRLLRLLEHYPTAAPFLREWQDAQRLAYIGGHDSHSVEQDMLDPRRSSYPHSRQFNTESHASMWHDAGFRSSAELSHLKRAYGSPRQSGGSNKSVEVELEHWVPLEAAEVSLRFFERHLPHTSHHVVASFLKRLNKVWRSAERKKIKRVKSEYEATIVDLKRQLLQSKPYESVMAVRQVRVLKRQLHEERARARLAHPRRADESVADDWLQEPSDDDPAEASKHERRLCQEVKRLEEILHNNRNILNGKVTIDELAAKSLLEASLLSLDILSQEVSRVNGATPAGLREKLKREEANLALENSSSTFFPSSFSAKRGERPADGSLSLSEQVIPALQQRLSPQRMQSVEDMSPEIKNSGTARGPSEANMTTDPDESVPDFYHRDPFLQGAIWLSRNLSVALDELYARVEDMQADCLSKLTSLLEQRHSQLDRFGSAKSVLHRHQSSESASTYRWTQMEDAYWNDALVLISRAFESEIDEFNSFRRHIRDIIEEAASVKPGDRDGLRYFISNLPVEKSCSRSSAHRSMNS